jgi:hypothetical protein
VAAQLVGGIDDVEPLEQRGDPAAAVGSGEVLQVSHQRQVLAAGEELVDGGELPGEPDRGADGVGIARNIVPGDADVSGIGRQPG